MSDTIEDGLTPEERAALEINDDEGGPEEVIAGADTTAQAKDDKDDEQDKDGADDGAAAAAGDAGAAAGEPAAEPAAAAAAAEPEAAQSPAPQQAPILVAEAPADAEAKLADIATQKDVLATKFDDGDITAKEYHAQLDALNKQERGIELAQHKAQLAAEMDEQSKRNAWFSQAQNFARENGYTDQRRLNLLDAEVRAVASTDDGAKLTGAQVLERAHQNLVDAGLAVAKNKPPAAPATPPKKPVDIPPSIHKLPAADTNDTASGQWAELDRLATTNPLKYEATLEAMSDAERERYLAA